MTSPSDWLGREIATEDGTRYGRLDELFVGRESGDPEFGIVTVARTGGDGTKRVAVPLRSASLHGDVVTLPLDMARVKAAPEVHGEVESIPPESGQRVLAHFGMAPPPGATTPPAPGLSDTQPTEPMPPLTPASETVLSEEQLDVSTETHAAERVRLRKHVVTEEVTVTVQLRREELVIVREPIERDAVGAPADDAFLDASETVIVLHAEEPVVGRRVVPVERVKLRRDMVVENVDIREPVRRERAEVEHIPSQEEPPR